MYLSQNLKYLREQKGLIQRELSDALGLSSSAVAMWEQRHRTPDIETSIKLAEYFNVTLDEFVLAELRPPISVYAINLLHLRTKHGMTQENMADFFGVTLDQLIKQNLLEEG